MCVSLLRTFQLRTTSYHDILISVNGIRPEGFNGRFAMMGYGLALGGGPSGNLTGNMVLDAMGKPHPDNGFSYGYTILGNAASSGVSTVKGLDFSVALIAGSSTVTKSSIKDCNCEK